MIITFKVDEDIVSITDTNKLSAIYADERDATIYGLIDNNKKIIVYGPYVTGEDGQLYSFKGIIPREVALKDIQNMMKFIDSSLFNKEDHILLKYN